MEVKSSIPIMLGIVMAKGVDGFNNSPTSVEKRVPICSKTLFGISIGSLR